jgi:hypothetical protein
MSCYTGNLFETEILFECAVVWDNYISYAKCIELVKSSQPRGWDPTDPPSVAGNDLHALVVEALDTDYSEVKLYTALHSALDQFHGVDCFIEYQGRYATIDLTINPYKDSYKADFVLQESDIYNNEGKVNQKTLRIKAQAIAHRLQAN